MTLILNTNTKFTCIHLFDLHLCCTSCDSVFTCYIHNHRHTELKLVHLTLGYTYTNIFTTIFFLNVGNEPGVHQVLDSNGEQPTTTKILMEETGCAVVCGAPMALTVTGQMK